MCKFYSGYGGVRGADSRFGVKIAENTQQNQPF